MRPPVECEDAVTLLFFAQVVAGGVAANQEVRQGLEEVGS